MSKPEKKYPVEKCYDYHEVIKYIENKFGYKTKDFSDYFNPDKTKAGKEYQDFWHWMVDGYEGGNGGVIYIPFYELSEKKPSEPDWIIKILTDIRNEFDPEQKEEGLQCWVEW